MIDKQLEEQEKQAARQRYMALAATKAVTRRNKYPGGPGTEVGTVIAGLVDALNQYLHDVDICSRWFEKSAPGASEK
ncbi:hypothetical protein [Actinomadura sp. DC4]|uniref:hypothetical protein n=1 Tax=Actinomadura sp. DC4 TaxID=3055069 RepID=UPI0025B15461|nr:hypothetical protein [Actinomadura sp. DC4]